MEPGFHGVRWIAPEKTVCKSAVRQPHQTAGGANVADTLHTANLLPVAGA